MAPNPHLAELDELISVASRHAGTPEGDALVAAARALRRSVPDDRGAVLRIAAAPGIPLGDVVDAFRQQNPQVEVSITVSRAGARFVRSGQADLGAVWLPARAHGLETAALGTEQPVVALSPSDPLAALARVDLAELGGHHLLQNPDAVPEWREIAAELKGRTIGTRKSLELGPLSTLGQQLDQVAAGNGIVILPRPVLEAEGRRDIVLVPIDGVGHSASALTWEGLDARPAVLAFARLAAGLR